MYKTLGESDYRNHLNLGNREIKSLIVYGGWNPSTTQLDWCEKAEYQRKEFFYPLFIDNGVAVTSTYGDAMTSEIAHVFSVLGAKKMILIGTFGALQPGIKFGEVFIPSSAVAEDGASRIYSAKTEFHPDQDLAHKAKSIWDDTTQQEGKIVSISAMLGETQEMINAWREKGYSGVDLETASFFAVADHFGVPALAMHTLADNLVEQQTVFDVNDSQRESKRNMKNELFKRALELAK